MSQEEAVHCGRHRLSGVANPRVAFTPSRAPARTAHSTGAYLKILSSVGLPDLHDPHACMPASRCKWLHQRALGNKDLLLGACRMFQTILFQPTQPNCWKVLLRPCP